MCIPNIWQGSTQSANRFPGIRVISEWYVDRNISSGISVEAGNNI